MKPGKKLHPGDTVWLYKYSGRSPVKMLARVLSVNNTQECYTLSVNEDGREKVFSINEVFLRENIVVSPLFDVMQGRNLE